MRSYAFPRPAELARVSLFDLAALAFVYLIPALSHLLAWPLYLAEPMRIVVILALAHTRRWNAFLLAFSLPLFSFMLASHPVFLKSVLISLELLFNVWCFYWLSRRIGNAVIPVLISILASKLLYYSLKYLSIQFGLIDSSLVSTPLAIQLVMLGIFGAYFLGLEVAGKKVRK